MNLKARKILPVVLSITSSIGVGATAYLAVKATQKVDSMPKPIDKLDNETKWQKFVREIKPYVPAISVGLATVASITTSTIISKKTEASLSASILMLEQGYKKYQGKVKKLFGIEGHENIVKEIAKDDFDEKKPEKEKDGKKLFWNRYIGFFYSTKFDVERAACNMNMRLNSSNASELLPHDQVGWCSLEQFVYDSKSELLDQKTYNEYKDFGWTTEMLNYLINDTWVHFLESEGKKDDGTEYTIVEFVACDPIYDAKTNAEEIAAQIENDGAFRLEYESAIERDDYYDSLHPMDDEEEIILNKEE